MIRTKTAMKKLTKGEQKHLTKYGINSMRTFRRLREKQQEVADRIYDGRIVMVCWDCHKIAKKLGK